MYCFEEAGKDLFTCYVCPHCSVVLQLCVHKSVGVVVTFLILCDPVDVVCVTAPSSGGHFRFDRIDWPRCKRVPPVVLVVSNWRLAYYRVSRSIAETRLVWWSN